jgi:hypothetical protein
MRFLNSVAAAVMSLIALAPSADAAIISGKLDFLAVNFSPPVGPVAAAPVDPVTGSFQYEFDLDQAYLQDTSVITNFTSNLGFSSPIYFTYTPSTDFLYLESKNTGPVNPGVNNFVLFLRTDFSSLGFLYSRVGESQIFGSMNVTLTPVNPVPIPGAVFMFVTALVGLGGAGFMRRRRAPASAEV